MKKLKVLTLAGTRPEIIRLSCIIKKFDQYFDHHFVHTGQNSAKELSNVFFKNFDIKPKYNFKIKNQNCFNLFTSPKFESIRFFLLCLEKNSK